MPSLPRALPNVKAIIIGCADMRVDPAPVLGIKPGEAVVIRNIGGRITPGLLEQLGLLGRIGELAGIGVAGDLIGALALTRVMAGLLFGVSTTDVVTLSVVALILAVVALIATVIPARRATRVDPIVALRDE
jgi:ABC-type lipoprotein release transport system permease subunit